MRSLFIGIVGAPNAGKSTLMNALLDQKISIVTHKAQTTRSNIRGIITQDDTQLVFIDSPGLFVPKKELEKKIVSHAKKTIEEAEQICVMIDVRKPIPDTVIDLLAKLKHKQRKCILILNKIDGVSQKKLLETISKLYDPEIIEEVFPISASKGYGVENLKQHLISIAKEDQWYYPKEDITDKNYQFLTSEITREKVFINLHNELPYSIDVVTDKFDQQTEIINIEQTVYVERDGHKMIAIGEKGNMIHKIASAAQQDIEKLTGSKINLKVAVRVKKDWISKWTK